MPRYPIPYPRLSRHWYRSAFTEDVACIIDAIFGNASPNSGVAVQYQGDAVQYRPINISVSIRISSPGNDGPVVQTNLVHVQASFSVEMGQAAQPLPGPLDVTVGLAPADGDCPQTSRSRCQSTGRVKACRMILAQPISSQARRILPVSR